MVKVLGFSFRVKVLGFRAHGRGLLAPQDQALTPLEAEIDSLTRKMQDFEFDKSCQGFDPAVEDMHADIKKKEQSKAAKDPLDPCVRLN